ncbi:DUF2971 domain-containing protein [Nitrospirillum pindoramense]|uniref:DUF2971 family protein n=1 Tax=Nitrospirillum amazonense TaxID=28077 RepID=A0A560HBD8_9PROT|nr:DUF2971 domain-containing protein [Nitrospirillum amazonense]TWB43421.1 DUF2971 family protein [Nitrospirillum amazonense]
MEHGDIQKLYGNHLSSIVNLVVMKERPLLAHYTSLSTMESILRGGEIWFSNPLFMNDFQEVRFGFIEGRNIVESEMLALDKNLDHIGQRVAIFLSAFTHYFKDYEEKHLFNLFIFCLSEFDPEFPDGSLSMWRGYGGNGTGAALVFRTDFIKMNADSPFLICQVAYGTDESRREKIRSVVEIAKSQVAGNLVPNDKLYILAHETFHVLRLLSLTSKHRGFMEEREWRVIYLPERDIQQRCPEYLTYIVGRNGVEPKLRHPLKPISLPEGTTYDWNFENIVDRILLGPTQATPLAIKGFSGMLKTLGKEELIGKVRASEIPFRPT